MSKQMSVRGEILGRVYAHGQALVFFIPHSMYPRSILPGRVHPAATPLVGRLPQHTISLCSVKSIIPNWAQARWVVTTCIPSSVSILNQYIFVGSMLGYPDAKTRCTVLPATLHGPFPISSFVPLWQITLPMCSYLSRTLFWHHLVNFSWVLDTPQ